MGTLMQAITPGQISILKSLELKPSIAGNYTLVIAMIQEYFLENDF